MAMEVLGGNLPAGRPVAVFAAGKTHVFAIAAGGSMNRWTSANGLDWTGPSELFRLNTNLEPSFPCAVALGNAVHVFAIGHGGPLSSGGPLVRWFSPDGTTFLPPVQDSAWPIPGGVSGIAACTPRPNRIDAFAVTPAGLIRYSFENMATTLGGSLGSAPLPAAPIPGNLPRSVPAAVSSSTDVIDVFVVAADGSALRWRTTDGLIWAASVLPLPASAPAGTAFRSGFSAVSPGPGQVEVFGVTTTGRLVNWSLNGTSVKATLLRPPAMALNDSIPGALVVRNRVEVFAIGQPPNPFTGGPLVRWRCRDRSRWGEADAKVIDASLSAGGLSATVASDGRIDAFGLGNGGLQHWPAGIAVASNERWANWANNIQFNPVRHCRPNTEEEVVAIVKTAERTSNIRVRAVGSSWSFTDITVPTSPGVIVETNGLRNLLTHVIDQSVRNERAPDAKYLVHVEAGIQVEELMTTLDEMGDVDELGNRKGLAPFTLGGSSGQTLAGVISTSVHGGHWDRGPIPNAVRAIQLVGPGGTRYWIEPDQWRITDQDKLRERLDAHVQIRYDDDWFDAVLVSMGAMGIITAVVLEVTDQYFLRKTCTEWRWPELRQKLADGSLFADPDHYVMVAFDPQGTGDDRACFLTTCRSTDGPTSGPPPTSDTLGAFCQMNATKACDFLETVAAVAGALTAPIRARTGPGVVGDLLAELFNTIRDGSEHLVTFASWMTREALKPDKIPSVDLAHKILAPIDRGECAARGLALELAFDATTGRYLTFVQEVLKLLDRRRAEGLVLGGWTSLRFVGPARAILSPQQSARTCMIEFVSVRGLRGTEPILIELEQLGREHGAIQHWGMHSLTNSVPGAAVALAAADLPRAYPRLDTWRRVRREITRDGSIRTFENASTARLALDAPANGVPVVWQQDWKFCSKCLGMAYAGGAPGRCPAGGDHDQSASGNYGFAHNVPSAPGQRKWRWCRRCMGMTLQNGIAGPCPAGETHDLDSSGEYTVVRNGQANWRRCNKCECLILGDTAAPNSCPAGDSHVYGGSEYWLPFAPMITVRVRSHPGAPPQAVLIEQPFSSEEIPGERGWRWCNRCQGLSKAEGKCFGGSAHVHNGSAAYLVPLNAPTASGQAHWRQCRKCQTLSFGPGRCFASAAGQNEPHDHVGSGDYTIRSAGQNQWRHCKSCNGLWFSGNGGRGRCPSPAGTHDLGPDDYVIAPR